IDGGVDAPGYEFKKAGPSGIWGVYAPPTEAKDWLPKELWIRQQQQLRAKREADKRRQYQEALSASERDKAIRKLAQVLGLNSSHREDLKRRGLTDIEITKGLFFSICPYAQLPADIPTNLPGVGYGGKLLSQTSGYACVAFDYLGRAIGWQVRVDGATDGNKYRWAKGLKSSHLKNGELPITIVKGVKLDETEDPVSTKYFGSNRLIYLVEGILKPYITSSRLGIDCLGAAGGLFTSSPEQVEAATADYDLVTLMPDAGDIINPHVMKRWGNQISLLQNQGLEVQIAWWGQVDKSAGDIDEISPETLIQHLSPQEFFQISHRERKNWEDWKRWIKTRDLLPAIKQNQRFVEFPSITSNQILFVKSGTGTGKTHQLLNKVLQELEGQGVLSIGYLNSPLLQFCSRSGDFYHLQSELKGSEEKILIRDHLTRLALCIHSLLYFDPEDFDGRPVILDEIVSVVRSLMFDSNLRYRDKIKYLFKEMLRRASQVYCLDGHLDQETVDFIMELAGDNKQAIVLENEFNSHRPQAKLVTGSYKKDGSIGEPDKGEMRKAILNNPHRFVVCSDSQQELETLDRLLTAQGRKVCRFDSTQVRKPWAKEFIREPVQYLRQNQVDTLLLSPSGESALDIPLEGYFQNIYCLSFGVLLIDQLLQLIARVRDSKAQLTIFAPRRALEEGIVAKDYVPQKLQESLEQYAWDELGATLDGDRDSNKPILNLVENVINAKKNDQFYRHQLILSAKLNYERDHLRKCFKYGLEQSGYEVEEIITTKDALTNSQIKEVKEQIRLGRCTKEFNSLNIITERAWEIRSNIAATESQRRAAAKRHLLDRLPGIEEETYQQGGESKPIYSPEFIKLVKFDERRLISKIETMWLVNNPEEAKQLNQRKWFKRLEGFLDDHDSNGVSQGLDWLKYKSKFLIAHTLRKMGIKKFLEPGRVWKSTDEDLIKFWKEGKKKSNSRKLGFYVGKASPVQYLGQVFRRLGLKTSSRRIRLGKDHIREYFIEEMGKIACAIYRCIDRKIREKLEHRPPDFTSIKNRILESLNGLNGKDSDRATPGNVINKKLARVAQKIEELVAAISKGAEAVRDVLASCTQEKRFYLIFAELEHYPEAITRFFDEYYKSPTVSPLLEVGWETG
ncbi:MAG: plasmid replication protein, CyRepA1 family, partial [Spirulinaceae cyanobacterium]